MNKHWTEDEITTLAGMKRAGLSNAIIAARLGKTVASVANQAHKISARRRVDGHGGRMGPGSGYCPSAFTGGQA